MSISRQQSLIHWNYFLAIEEDIERLSRFVDFNGNENTYSLEIARLLLSCCAEIDVVLQQLCKAMRATSKASNIEKYFLEVSAGIPDFFTFEVQIPRFTLSLTPWLSWSPQHPPLWWTAHNRVKHARHEHFDKANLINCLNSAAGLYVSVLYLYQNQAVEGELKQLPRLFNVGDAYFGGVTMGRYGHSLRYKLPVKQD